MDIRILPIGIWWGMAINFFLWVGMGWSHLRHEYMVLDTIIILIIAGLFSIPVILAVILLNWIITGEIT